MKRETFEEFKERIGFKLDNDDSDLNLSILIYYGSIYCHEQNLNCRRQVLKIKKILSTLKEN